MSSTGFIKPGNALAIVVLIGLAATVVVGAEGDNDSLLQSGRGDAASIAAEKGRLGEVPPARSQARSQRASRRSSAPGGGDFTREEELVDSAEGEAPRGYEIEPTFDSGVPHKIDPEAEAKEKAQRIAEDDDAVATPRVGPAKPPGEDAD